MAKTDRDAARKVPRSTAGFTRPRWAPHVPLTKKTKDAHLFPLLQVMASGYYKLKAEKDELSYRRDLKESGQTVTRLKGKPFNDDTEFSLFDALS